MPPAASSCWLSWPRWKMADLLTAHLPDSWHGRRIDPDFRHMVRLSNAYAHGRLDGEHPEEALAMMERFYHKPVPPEQLPDAYGCMVDFYRAGEQAAAGTASEPDSGPEKPPAFDYQCDAGYIVAAFQQAYGIDAAAHRAALEAGGLTVAVLGGGLGELYPRRHLRLFDKICEQGALVTEQSPWTPPLPQNFPLRNRIIVGLSRSVLVVEAAIRSGAMSTAHAAADENRDLYAVPGPIDSETSQGTHWLLKQGARLGDDPRELLDSLLGREPGTCTGPAEEEEPDLFGEVSPEEQERAGALYRWIKKHRAQSLEDLAGAFPWSLAVLSTLLLELELGGRIRRNSRNRYSAL